MVLLHPPNHYRIPVEGENLQHVGVLRAFADAILNGGQPVAAGIEGINGLTISNAMHLSSWTGKPVTLPFDEDRYLDELNQRRATSRLKESRSVYSDTSWIIRFQNRRADRATG